MNKLLPLVLVSVLTVACGQSRPRRARSRPIRVGQSIEGRLDANDWTDVFADGSYTDLYELTLHQGEQVSVELSSDHFDTYLSLLRGPGDQIIDNDDAAPGTTNSRIVYRAPTDLRLYVAVTTLRAGDTGPYRLVVRRDGGSSDEATPEGGGADASRRSRDKVPSDGSGDRAAQTSQHR